jgi:hypothetical protein
MLQAIEAARPKKQASARGKHLAWARRTPGTHQWTPQRRAPFGRSLDALFPWQQATYPGKLKGFLNVLNGRASRAALKHWLRGTRRTPKWALHLAAVAIEKRIAELQHALAIIKKETGD